MGINVDFDDSVIYITSPTTSVTVQELVDAIRAAEDSTIGINYPSIMDAVGKADLGGGTTTGITMTINSPWYIEFWNGVLLGSVIDGNVVGGLDNRPIRADVGSADTVLQLGAQAVAIVSTSGSALTPEEHDWLEANNKGIKVIKGEVL